MKRYFILLSFVLVFISCQKREWTNPFDPDCPKDIWTPINFTAVQEGTSVKLTWTQPVNPVSGFKIQKAIDGGSSNGLPDQSKGSNQFTDNSLTGGKVHVYSLTAYAGENTSNTVTAQITPILTAEIITSAVSAITSNSATSGGSITTDGGAAITARGVCWSTNQNPTIADNKTSNALGSDSYTSSLNGLTPGATYNIRAYAINGQGIAYGNEVSFKTNVTLSIATLTTSTPTNITSNSATLGGNVTSDGNTAVTERGVCYSTSQNPTINNTKVIMGSGAGTFTITCTGLLVDATYYVRAYAINSQGTAYGNQLNFIAGGPGGVPGNDAGTISDIDGNVYHTVTIGTQVWMVENLKTTKYNDGTVIPYITDNTIWQSNATGAYCWYNNDVINKNVYGALYNWKAVNTGKLAPFGWHVSTDTDWTTLTNFLGGESVAGGKLKEVGISHWIAPNTGATNTSGFTALPGGYRDATGPYGGVGNMSHWLTSTEYSLYYGWRRDIQSQNDNVVRSGSYGGYGFYIRCVKD